MPFSALLLQIPDWLLVVLCVLFTAGISVLGLILAHKVVPAAVMKLHNDVAGFVFAIVGVIYAVLLAFVVLVVWEQFNEASSVASTEGATALALGRSIEAFPDEADSQRLNPLFNAYIKQVVECEYPAQAHFTDCPASRAAFKELWRAVVRVVPETAGEQVVLGAIIDTLTSLQVNRTLRQTQAHHGVPGAVWIAIVFGAFLTIGFTFLFGAENRWAQFIITASLGAMIGLVVSIVILLNHPFSGELSVKPQVYEHILHLNNGQRPSQH